MSLETRLCYRWAVDFSVKDLGRLGRPAPHCVRIETGTQGGVPDWEGCYAGVSFWVEDKRAPRRKTDDAAVLSYRPGQLEFLAERWSVGGVAAGLVATHALGGAVDVRRYLLPADELCLLPRHVDPHTGERFVAFEADANARFLVRDRVELFERLRQMRRDAP